ncbi:hypothetical protein [Demequina lutea]|uniref:NUDIX domain-containing protein n=1 Tax=Demequina lutea TaxID=431489 RepID=A0A7Y9Z8N6_9MICO|nr:hypothetical protein [Demequina lutea]NYI40265.1 hypothetical protein [Demequina lutea]
MPANNGIVIAQLEHPPWLPPGSSAQIRRGGAAPRPMCLVRLLLRKDDLIFTLPRDDTGKLDLPTRRTEVHDLDGTEAITLLQQEVTGVVGNARFVGSVRNLVETPTDDYEWPTPIAHFGVWEAGVQPMVPGHWLNPEEAESPLRDRHWYPLLSRPSTP